MFAISVQLLSLPAQYITFFHTLDCITIIRVYCRMMVICDNESALYSQLTKSCWTLAVEVSFLNTE